MPSKASDLRLVPYVNVEGEWTLPDESLMAVAAAAQEDGTFGTVFYTGRVKTLREFVTTMQNPANLPVFAFRGDEPLAFGWLNNLSGGHAFAHFCVLSAAWGEDSLAVGRLGLDYWMWLKRANGEPLLDVLVGTIPVTNEKAIAFSQRLGFVRVGQIPMMARNARGDREAVMILYYCRG